MNKETKQIIAYAACTSFFIVLFALVSKCCGIETAATAFIVAISFTILFLALHVINTPPGQEEKDGVADEPKAAGKKANKVNAAKPAVKKENNADAPKSAKRPVNYPPLNS